jgi:hypothetical protein
MMDLGDKPNSTMCPNSKETGMAINDLIKRTGRGLAVAAAVAALVSFSAPTQARVSTGAAVGIGLGAFALGAAAGSAAAHPYGYYPYGYYAPPPAYYAPPAPAYYAPARNCWDPYYQRYYAC